MKRRLLCFAMTLGCIVGLLAGCGEAPGAQNGSFSSSGMASSQSMSSGGDPSDLSSPEQSAQSTQEPSSEGGKPSPSSQNQGETSTSTSNKGDSSKASSSASKSTGQGTGASGGKDTASSAPASTQNNTPSRPATTAPNTPSHGGNNDRQEEQKDPQTVTITLSIECKAAVDKGNAIAKKVSDENGYILPPTTIEFNVEEKATVYDALKETGLVIVSEEGMFGQYVKSIQSLKEGTFGGQDGWKYEVNGVFPGFSCSKYELNDGDTVAWHYSLTA